MNKNIKKRLRRYLCITLAICLLTTFGVEAINEISFSTEDISSDLGKAGNLLSSFKYILALITGTAVLITSIARDIELHKLIDEMTIDARSKTGDIIVNEMRDSANEVCGVERSEMRDRNEIINLFYRFVNNFDETRSLAFTYWEDYYVRLYAISLFLLGLMYTAYFNIYEYIVSIYYPLYVSGPIVFMCLLILLYRNLNKRLVKRIYKLPKQQISNIKNTYRNEFKKEVQSRFA